MTSISHSPKSLKIQFVFELIGFVNRRTDLNQKFHVLRIPNLQPRYKISDIHIEQFLRYRDQNLFWDRRTGWCMQYRLKVSFFSNFKSLDHTALKIVC